MKPYAKPTIRPITDPEKVAQLDEAFGHQRAATMTNDGTCPTCLAIRFEGMTVELAHCVGVAIGVSLTGEHHDPKKARRDVEEHFCREHADLIFGAARTIADQLRGRGLLT